MMHKGCDYMRGFIGNWAVIVFEVAESDKYHGWIMNEQEY